MDKFGINIKFDLVTDTELEPYLYGAEEGYGGSFSFHYDPSGRPLPCLANVVEALCWTDEIAKVHVFFKFAPVAMVAYAKRIYLEDKGGAKYALLADWKTIDDIEILKLRYRLELLGICPCSDDLVRDALRVMPSFPSYREGGHAERLARDCSAARPQITQDERAGDDLV